MASNYQNPSVLSRSIQDDTKSSFPSHRSARTFKCHLCPRSVNSAQGLKSHITRMHKNNEDEAIQISLTSQEWTDEQNDVSLERLLGNLKTTLKVMRRVPKGARSCAAEALADTIEECLRDKSAKSWERLLLFTAICLPVPEKQKNQQVSLTTLVKQNISDFLAGKVLNLRKSAPILKKSPRSADTISKLIQAKLSDGDVRGAVRLLSSEDTFAPNNSTTLAALIDKHPSPATEPSRAPTEGEPICASLRVSEPDVVGVISSFPAGSAGGLDLLRPQHLKDLTGHSAGLAGKRLITSLTKLCNVMLSGGVPGKICPIIYGASLCAFKKKNGDIRPIAIGCTLRRLVAKLGSNHMSSKLGKNFQPIQLGFGTKKGTEAATHSARRYVNFQHRDPKVLLKIDFRNAFNMINREHMLQTVSEQIPELFSFLDQCYRSPSHLLFGENIISSARGVQQGDPLGPGLFCLEVHPVASSMVSELNIWYLDDATLGGTPKEVFQDFVSLVDKSAELGLVVNPSKCELFCLSGQKKDSQGILSMFQSVAPDIKLLPLNECNLLGSPLMKEATSECLEGRTEALKRISDRLIGLPAHCSFYILKNSQAIPKLTHILRCAPTWECPENLGKFDSTLREALEAVTNISLSDEAWEQSSWPVSRGGLGIRHAKDLSLPAFLSSVHGTLEQVRRILPKELRESTDDLLTLGLEKWKLVSRSQPPSEEKWHSQKEWERPIIDGSINKLHEQATSELVKARLIGVSSPQSGAFLNALPSAPLGTLLDDDAFRISVALRLGSNLCQPHMCCCGTQVNESGTHGLSCRRSSGRAARHASVNDIIKRALNSAGVPAALEPPHLEMDNNKRPDGITQIPWAGGKSLVWDFTCTDGLAPSHVAVSSVEPLYAASTAERNKRAKYAHLAQSHIFTPVAVECLGSFGRESLAFIRAVGKKITASTGETRATEYLIQRISVAVQRGNATAIKGTIPTGVSLDDFISLL